MFKYILKRLLQSVITLIIVITIVFLLLRLMPIEGYFPTNYDKMTQAQITNHLNGMGLNDPIHYQLINFFKNLVKGDLGNSNIYRPNVAITKILKAKIPYSLAIGGTSILISLVCGIGLGVAMAKYKNGFVDKLGTGFIVIVSAVPAAIYYIFLQLYISNILNIPMLFDSGNPKSWILPILSLSLGTTAYYAMWMRRYMVDELNKDYVKLARAKGVKSGKIMSQHIFKNAFVPIIQFIPTSILITLMGSIYVESLYSIPGMGGLLVDVIQRQDNSVVQALVIIYSSLGIVGLMLGDLLMAIVDPRIKLIK